LTILLNLLSTYIDNKRVLSLDRILLLDYYCIVKLMRLLIWLNRFQRSDASYRRDNFKVVLTIWR
jgi:hypothetical protein